MKPATAQMALEALKDLVARAKDAKSFMDKDIVEGEQVYTASSRLTAGMATALSVITAIEADIAQAVEPPKTAPVQGYTPGIPWSIHLEAYDVYRKKYGAQQALIEGWCRGGFGVRELDDFIPGWRDRVSEIGKLRDELASTQRMFTAACVDLGAVAESLGIDPNAGGAAPILAAIAELQKSAPQIANTKQADEITCLHGEAGVLRDLLKLTQEPLRICHGLMDETEESKLMADLLGKIDAALRPVPVVQFLAADDSEGGNL